MVVGPPGPEYKGRVNHPDSPPPIDSSSPAGTHRGPPQETRPRSTLGLWALFLSMLLALTSTMVGFVWVLLLPAVLLAIYGVVKIRPERFRGQGMAIIALIVALMAGSCTYMFAGIFRDLSAHYAGGVLAALAGSEDRRLDDWLLESAREEGVRDTLRTRYREVVDQAGPYQKEIVQAPSLVGGRGVIYPPAPDAVEEVGGDGKDPPRSLEQNAIWARARFEREVLLVELTFGKSREGFEAGLQGVQAQKAFQALSDVRFWRQIGAPAE